MHASDVSLNKEMQAIAGLLGKIKRWLAAIGLQPTNEVRFIARVKWQGAQKAVQGELRSRCRLIGTTITSLLVC